MAVPDVAAGLLRLHATVLLALRSGGSGTAGAAETGRSAPATLVPDQAGPADSGPLPGDAPPPGDDPDGAPAVWATVRRAQSGDPEAFAELYDRYVDVVFRYVHFRVGTRALAEDLTSETFLRALRRIATVSWQGRDFGAWLITIARNLVADHYKSGRYRLEISTADMLDADRADTPEGRPEQAVVDALTSEALLAAVRQLGPDQQECVVLRFLHGLSVAETAEAMGRNTGAIKALQYRAVRSLARLLPEGLAPS